MLISPILILFSLYSVSDNNWIWDNGNDWQKILGTISGLAAFTGIFATILFFQREKKAYYFAISNAVLFGIYALSVNLTGDFIVNLIWYVAVFIYMIIKERKDQLKNRRITLEMYIFIGATFIVGFLFFWFLTPYINKEWGKLINFNTTYGSNFNYYWASRVLDTLSNTISIITIIMMIKGYWQTWFFWIAKDVISITLFGGIGFVNISIIIMNIVYLLISIYILYKYFSTKIIRIAFIGPGAVGKSTTINYLSDFFKKYGFILIDERTETDNNNFKKYMSDLKNNAFKAQVNFFEKRIEQSWRLHSVEKGIMDRHSTDDFLFSHLHIKLGNFSENEIFKWKKLEKKYWRELRSMPKLDHLFLLMADNKIIEDRRNERSSLDYFRKEEKTNTDFFRKVNNEYNDPNNIMRKAFIFSKNVHEIVNSDSKKTSKLIRKIIMNNFEAEH